MSSDCSYRAYRHVVSADGIDEIHDRKSRWLCSHHANAIDVRIHRHLLPPSRQKPTEDALAQERGLYATFAPAASNHPSMQYLHKDWECRHTLSTTHHSGHGGVERSVPLHFLNRRISAHSARLI